MQAASFWSAVLSQISAIFIVAQILPKVTLPFVSDEMSDVLFGAFDCGIMLANQLI